MSHLHCHRTYHCCSGRPHRLTLLSAISEESTPSCCELLILCNSQRWLFLVVWQDMGLLAGSSVALRRHGDEFERLPGGYYRALGRCDDTMNLGGIKA